MAKLPSIVQQRIQQVMASSNFTNNLGMRLTKLESKLFFFFFCIILHDIARSIPEEAAAFSRAHAQHTHPTHSISIYLKPLITLVGRVESQIDVKEQHLQHHGFVHGCF
jgi:hypothetical protein